MKQTKVDFSGNWGQGVGQENGSYQIPVSGLIVIIVLTASKAGISRDGRSPCSAIGSLSNGAWKI